MEQVLEELDSLCLDRLDEDWVQAIYHSEFLEIADFPPDYESAIESVNIKQVFQNIMKAVETWLDSEHETEEEKSWASLSSKVPHQRLLTVLAFYIDYGTKNVHTKEYRNNALLASRVYYTFLSIPGFKAYHIYHAQLFCHSLACLGFPKEMCDKDDNYYNTKELTREVNSVIRELRPYVLDLRSVVEKLQLKPTDMNFEDILSHLVDITGGAIVNKLNIDKIELANISQVIYMMIDTLLVEPSGEPDAVAIRLLFKCLLPKLVSASLDCRNANNLVRASYVTYAAILLSKYAKAAVSGFHVLLQHLCYAVEGLERAEVRQARVSLVVGLMSLLPHRTYRSVVKWLLKLTTTAKISHRHIGMEILFELLSNDPEESTETKTKPIPDESQPEIKQPIVRLVRTDLTQMQSRKKISEASMVTETTAVATETSTNNNETGANPVTETPVMETETSTNTVTETPVLETETSTNTVTETETPVLETETSTNMVTETPVLETETSTNMVTETPVLETVTYTNTVTETPVLETETSTNMVTETPVLEKVTYTNTVTETPVLETETSTNMVTETPVLETETSANMVTETPVLETETSANMVTETPVLETETFTNTVTETPVLETETSANMVTETPVLETETSANMVTETPVLETETSANMVTETPVLETETFTNTVTETPVLETETSANMVTETPVLETETSANMVTETPVLETETSANMVTETPVLETETFTNTVTETPILETETSTNTVTETSTVEIETTTNNESEDTEVNQPNSLLPIDDQTLEGLLLADQPPDQTFDELMSIDQPLDDQMVVNQTMGDQSAIDQAMGEKEDQSKIIQSTADQSKMVQSTVDQLKVDHLTVDQLTVDQSTVDQLTVDKSTVDQSTMDQLTAVSTEDESSQEAVAEMEHEPTEEEVAGLLLTRRHTVPHGLVLRALLARANDASSTLRSRALGILAACADRPGGTHAARAFQELNGSGAVGRLVGAAARCASDERAAVRRAALQLLHRMMRRHERDVTPTNLGVLVSLCRDASILVRSAAISALGELTIQWGRASVTDAFLTGPLHQLSDPETKVQEQLVSLIQQILIERLQKYSPVAGDQLPWTFLGAVTRHNMRRHLQKACTLLAKSAKCISHRIVDILSTHLGAAGDEHDLQCLVLLTSVSRHVDCTELGFLLDYYYRITADTDQERDARLLPLTLELLTDWSTFLSDDARSDLRAHLIRALGEASAAADSCRTSCAALAAHLDPLSLQWANELLQIYQRRALSGGAISEWVCAADMSLVAPQPPDDALLQLFLNALDTPPIECSNAQRGCLVAGVGRLCARSRDAAAAAAPPLARLLYCDAEPMQARVNALLTLTDICTRYTCIVEPLLGCVVSCLCPSACAELRRAAATALTRLLLGGYLRLRTPLYYTYCALLADEEHDVREPAEYYVTCCLTADAIYHHFVECVLHYNKEDSENISFDARQLIYDVMLQRMSLVQKLNIQCRLATEILEHAADMCDEGDGELSPGLSAALLDTITLLCGPRMKLPRKPQKDGEADIDDLQERVTTNIVSHKMKRTVAEVLVPAVLRLYARLRPRGGQLCVYLVRIATDLLKDYRQEIEELIENDSELVSSIRLFQENIGTVATFGNTRNLVTTSTGAEPDTPRAPRRRARHTTPRGPAPKRKLRV